MMDINQIWLKNAENTAFCGKSLANSLYGPIDIYLDGELGAGKTTFLNGFANALGINDYLTSPTYALEQRYTLNSPLQELIHIDLYRLETDGARDLIASTDDHTGIRCIEWASRLDIPLNDGIHLQFEDPMDGEGRNLTLSLQHIPLPEYREVLQWRKEFMLPQHICDHCDAVAQFSRKIAETLIQDGQIIHAEAVERAGQLHDLLRFVDFATGASHSSENSSNEQIAHWNVIRQQCNGMRHEEACAEFLGDKGYDALSKIVRTHGPGSKATAPRTTVEQKILYYADKRAIVDKIVTIEERFEDFRQRYTNGKETPDGKVWYEEAKSVEQELFPDGAPY